MNRRAALFTKGLVAFGIVLSCTVTGTIASAAPRTPMHKGTLVALGDSITFGYNLDDTHNNSVPSQYAFPYLIGRADGLSVSDLGIPGWTSADLLSNLQSPNFSRAIRGASAITIDIGNNDLLQWASANGLLSGGSTSLTPQQYLEVQNVITQFGKNFAASIALIRSESSAPIIAYNLYDPFPNQSPLHPLDEPLEALVNAAITQVAAANKDVVVANAHAAFDGNQLADVRVAEGDVHPTVVGQSVLAQIGEQALQTYLRHLKSPNLFSGVTNLLAGGVAQSGGTVTGTLNGSSVSLAIPAGSLNKGTEADITSQEMKFPGPAGRFNFLRRIVITEDAVNLTSSVAMSSPYTLTITNPHISKDASVYEISGTGITKVTSATVTRGQATIRAAGGGDFIVVGSPQWTMFK